MARKERSGGTEKEGMIQEVTQDVLITYFMAGKER